MDLKESIIREFNLLIDNLQNSFIESLKKRLLQCDQATEASPDEDLPLKRQDSSRTKKLRKSSKLSEELKESKDLQTTQPDPQPSKSKEPKPKKVRKNSSDTSQDHIPKKAEVPEPRIEKKRSEERLEGKTEKPDRDLKDPKDKKDLKDLKEGKTDTKTSEVRVAKKTEERSPEETKKPDDAKKPEEKSKERPENIAKKTHSYDQVKVSKWTDHFEKIKSSSSENNDQVLYKVLMAFSQDINDKISEPEVEYVDMSLNYLREIQHDAHKNIKPLINSILTRSKKHLPRQNHINNRLESFGLKLS